MRSAAPITGGGSCIICTSRNLVDILQTPALPVMCTQLVYTAEEARRVSRAVIALAGCRRCGHMFNTAFDPALVVYDSTYENSLMASPRYRQYTIDLIENLISSHDFTGGTVVEIGCGRGEFLRMLCERGIRRAIGFDPGRPGEVAALGEATIEIIDASFDPATAPRAPDLVCSRHVLEHLASPVALLRSIAAAYAPAGRSRLFIEVPNGMHMAEKLSIWDLVYAHVSYFLPSSLSWALRSAGIAEQRIEAAFGGQFIVVEAKLSRSAAEVQLPELVPITPTRPFAALQDGFSTTVNASDRWLREAAKSGRRVALWGAGAKAVTFLNLLDQSDRPAIGLAIDINPLKWGTYVAGTGHPIAAPSALGEFRPDAVLIMNSEYKSEIDQTLNHLGVRADVIAASSLAKSNVQ